MSRSIHDGPFVNLLLLLSALLSALTGVTAAVPARATPQQMSRDVVQQRAEMRGTVSQGVRPVQPLACLAELARPPLLRSIAIAAPEPIFAGRRRE